MAKSRKRPDQPEANSDGYVLSFTLGVNADGHIKFSCDIPPDEDHLEDASVLLAAMVGGRAEDLVGQLILEWGDRTGRQFLANELVRRLAGHLRGKKLVVEPTEVFRMPNDIPNDRV